MKAGDIVLAGGVRTPFARAGTALAARTARELGRHAATALLSRTGVAPGKVGALCFGTVVLDPRTPNPAREIILESDLPPAAVGYTVSNYCISGIRSATSIADLVGRGAIEAGIAAGADSMSNPPVMVGPEAVRILAQAAAARGPAAKLRALLRLRPRHLRLAAPGVAEPSTGLTMGEHCELMAKEWSVPRLLQDDIALRSHRRAAAAWEDGRLAAEVEPLDGLLRDNLLRPDTSAERLAALSPVFDRSHAGTITAGNSSPLTDGGAALLIMTRAAAERAGLPALATLSDWEYAALHPSEGLLMAPALAVPRLLARRGLTLNDIDLVEIHEAFGAQVAANLFAWERGWREPPIGQVDPARLNVNGSSIAVGHPFAATGGRILLTLAREMERRGARRGLASLCAAGGMAAAVLLERP